MLQWLANHASIFQGNSRPWEIFFNHFSLERKETNSIDIYYTFGKESEHKSKGANGHYTYIIFCEDWEAEKRPQIGESLQLPPRPRAEGLRQPQWQGSDLSRNERGRWRGCLGKGGKKSWTEFPTADLRPPQRVLSHQHNVEINIPKHRLPRVLTSPCGCFLISDGGKPPAPPYFYKIHF